MKKKMYYQSCILCNHRKFFKISSKNRTNASTSIVICRNCSLVQVNPRQNKVKVSCFYRNNYHQNSTGHEIPDQKFIEKSARFARERIEILNQFSTFSNAALLDIGCSYGEFLRQIKPLVKKSKGIEPGGNFYSYGINKLNLDIFNGTLDEYIKNDHSKYDIVTLFNVLEHVNSPFNFLMKINNLLADDGVLFLEVPDFFSFLKSIRIRKKLSFYFSPFHLQYFSEKTIERTLNSAGLQISVIDHTHANYLRVLAKKINKPVDKSNFHARKRKKNEIIYILFFSWIWKVKSLLM